MPPKPRRVPHAHEIAIAIREGMPPSLYLEWQLSILSGISPELVRGTKGDPDKWYIRPEKGGLAPNAEQKQRALKDLMDRGYGQAVQAIALQAELRTASLDAGQQLPTGQLTPGAIWAVEQAIRGALGAGAPAPTTASVIDAECIEAPTSASADDDDDDGDDDDQDLEQPAPTTASDHDDDE